MSQITRLQERRDEITADLAAIAATAAGFNRTYSSGERSRRKALATDLKVISKKIAENCAADDLAKRIVQGTPTGMFADF